MAAHYGLRWVRVHADGTELCRWYHPGPWTGMRYNMVLPRLAGQISLH